MQLAATMGSPCTPSGVGVPLKTQMLEPLTNTIMSKLILKGNAVLKTKYQPPGRNQSGVKRLRASGQYAATVIQPSGPLPASA